MNNSNKIALACALLCSSAAGFAQEVVDINPSWYIQPAVVGMKPDIEFGTDDRDWGGGLKFGRAVNRNWDMQVGATRVGVHDGPRYYRQNTLGVDGLWMMSRQAFRPFLLVGAGLQRDAVDDPLRRVRNNSPYLSAGLGFQVGLSERVALQADWRSVWGKLRNEERLGFTHSHNKYLTFGLNIAMGPRAVAAAPVVAAAPEPAPQPVVETPPPAPQPVEAPPEPARFDKVVLAAAELFELNSAKLRGSQPRLDKVAEALAAEPRLTNILVTGHADRLGSDEYNQQLSEKRANAVREYLVGKGIDGSRLSAQGKGEAEPIVECDNANKADLIKCLEPNRRVEVENVVVEQPAQ